jgi:elongation factor Ts
MAQITAQQVKQLRDETNLGMMECKKALVETDGDMNAAIKMLREKGELAAAKRADRETKQGVIASALRDGKLGVLVEVGCETDFVAKNSTFQTYVQEIADQGLDVDNLAEAVNDKIVGMIQEIGEKIIVSASTKYELQGTGIVSSYIHMGGKVGVLIEVGCENDATIGNELFAETVKDLTLHIAAANPTCVSRDEVPAETVAAEREIFAKQVEGKPENIIDKIVDGKMAKFYSQICVLEQEFVKDTDMSITQLLQARGKELGDTLSIRRFTRYQIGG